MFKLTLTFLTLVFPISAFAVGGDELGNGGDVLYCARNGKYTFESFDLFEAGGSHGIFEVREFPEEKAFAESAFFAGLKAKDPGRACLYAKWNKEFRRDSVMLDLPVYNVADEGLVMIPKNCKLMQAVVQYKHSARQRPRYFIYSDVYFKLDEVNRLAIRIHEFIYREGVAMNLPRFKNSMGVRAFNSFLFSKRMLVAPQADYDFLVSSVGLPLSEDYCDENHPIYK